MPPPAAPKIYHILHLDRLPHIIEDGALWSDATLQQQPRPGTTIGINAIKQRRLSNPLKCHLGLKVGDCVPFYFCPRSVMLYLIHKANHPELGYHGGQGSIVHLEADLHEAVYWAERNQRRWAFTLSNAGSQYFQDHCDLAELDEVDWEAVRERDWQACRDRKQAEFLVERSFPWTLVQRVGVCTPGCYGEAKEAMRSATHQAAVQVKPEWYY